MELQSLHLCKEQPRRIQKPTLQGGASSNPEANVANSFNPGKLNRWFGCSSLFIGLAIGGSDFSDHVGSEVVLFTLPECLRDL
nr:hypothetical protein Iba_chr08fCG4690 [Ipomoea batatas]